MPQNSQWAIARAVAEDAGWVEPSVEGYTAALYSGKKAPLRPHHDAVLALATSVASDVDVQGRSTYIPLAHKSQFAAIAPGPRGVLRVGLRLREVPADMDARIEPVTNFAQATHRVDLPGDTDPHDAAALEWLRPYFRMAYEQNG